MKIEISDKKVKVTLFGRTAICTYDKLVEEFKQADESKRKRMAINHFDTYVMPLIPLPESKSYHILEKQSPEWDDEAQKELEEIQGADPYLPLY